MAVRSHIVLHHSKTKDGLVVDAPAIFRFHTSYRHAGAIISEAEFLRLRALATPGLEPAAACPQGDMNQVGLHVCVVGDYDAQAPDAEVLEVLVRRVVGPWMRLFGIPAGRIVGHRTFNPGKSCPGARFDLEVVRRMVR